MTDDRLDAMTPGDIAQIIEAVRRLGPELSNRVSEGISRLQSELRDARAEIERLRGLLDAYHETAHDNFPATRALEQSAFDKLCAAFAAEQAKVQRVAALADDWIKSGVVCVHESAQELGEMVRAALAGDDQ